MCNNLNGFPFSFEPKRFIFINQMLTKRKNPQRKKENVCVLCKLTSQMLETSKQIHPFIYFHVNSFIRNRNRCHKNGNFTIQLELFFFCLYVFRVYACVHLHLLSVPPFAVIKDIPP